MFFQEQNISTRVDKESVLGRGSSRSKASEVGSAQGHLGKWGGPRLGLAVGTLIDSEQELGFCSLL